MSDRRLKPLSTRGPMTLFIIVLVLMVVLTVLWNVVLTHDYQKLRELTAQAGAFHWTFVALGSALFLTIIILSSILGAQLIGQIRWSQSQRDFVASVSHELNSPLSAIKLFAQTLRQGDLSDQDRQSFVEKILYDVERLNRLIANILRAAELDRRGEDLQTIMQDVELGEYLRAYMADAIVLHQEENLEISLTAIDDAWVDLDRMMFRQVLDNLVDNAVRYRGNKAPKVELRVRRDDDRIELSVRDHGQGVPPAELPRLFERFYQVNHGIGGRGRRGTGIGLFVVRSIVQAHGGKVSATSGGEGHGTTIKLLLPALTRDAQAA